MVADTHSEHIEIDIYEMLGHEPEVFYTSLHAENYHDGLHIKHEGYEHGDFITVGVDWGPDYIDWYYNERKVASASVAFSVPMYIIVNLAVGGSWGGDPTNETKFPATLQVDYVRVYQKIDRLNEATSKG